MTGDNAKPSTCCGKGDSGCVCGMSCTSRFLTLCFLPHPRLARDISMSHHVHQPNIPTSPPFRAPFQPLSRAHSHCLYKATSLTLSANLQPSKPPAPAARPTPCTAHATRPRRRTRSRDPGARAAPVPQDSARATAPTRRTLSSPSRPPGRVLAALGPPVRF